MKTDRAEEIAREALIWLAGQPEALGQFLAETGVDPANLRQRAADPMALGFVLDFLLGNEALLVSFASDAGMSPEVPARARAALPGGDLPNWT